MIQKVINLYTYRELQELTKERKIPGKALELAKNWIREGQTQDSHWHEYLVELWKSALDQIGFEKAVIDFSGFGSQGDGASFTASVAWPRLVDFLSRDFEPSEVIPVDRSLPAGEDFRGWLVKKVGGKASANARYRRLMPFAEAGVLELALKRTDCRYSHAHTVHVQADFSQDYLRHGGRPRWPAVEKLFYALVEDVRLLRLALCRAIYRDLNDEYDHLHSDEAIEAAAEANGWTFRDNGRRED